MFTALILFALGHQGQNPAPAPKYDMKVRQLILFKDGAAENRLTGEAFGAKQPAHLEFLKKLYQERKALFAGPIMAENAPFRGVLLLDVATKAEAEQILLDEPLSKTGHYVLEYRPWFMARNIPQVGPEFFDLEPMWFGLLYRPKDAPELPKEELEQIQAGHMANIERMAASGDLVLAGPMGEPGELRGIFIFRTKSKGKILEMAAQDTAIQRGRLRLELYPWYVTKGTFPVEKSEKDGR